MPETKPRKIFQSLPLGELSKGDVAKPEAVKRAAATPQSAQATSEEKPRNAKPRKSPVPHIPDIPPQSAYRVNTLGRGTGTLSNVNKWRTEAMRSHRSPTLLWFTRGQGRITVAGVTRGFGPHNLIYLPTRTMYGFEPVGQVMGYTVHLPDKPSFALPKEPLHMRFREVIQQNEITGMIEGLQREIDGDRPGRDRAMEFQAGMIAVWLERQMSVMPDYNLTPDASRRLAAAYTALVESKLREGYTVAQFAAELGVSPTHLTRACNIACGRSASAILADRVHFEARRMLSETDLPIKQIAQKLGFHSAAYFSRAFHKHTGQSPRAFRQSA
ncbi:AraC family transcriptional regulator [Celeribacter halophilus]|uniref:AraC family transcriptional regulator n=1 Tax=Celeribacter halophilus TaxID=576117 RepID=A0AAW7XPV5_9RHOB|nr:AraC family transcriptional regulator [Celeribacter halophilus]MDO6455742.1 AraC family transcriptional regulator [Celeribacter halophilus]MDO6721932.1 AraC family transcriptional regulator [Celeribacter halophilus]